MLLLVVFALILLPCADGMQVRLRRAKNSWALAMSAKDPAKQKPVLIANNGPLPQASNKSRKPPRSGPGDGKFFKLSIPEAVETMKMSVERGDMTSFLSTLKNFAFMQSSKTEKNPGNVFPVRGKAGSDILNLISQKMDMFDANAATEILWSISKMGYRLSTPKEREVISALMTRLCSFQTSGEEWTPRQVTTSIGGLAKLGFKWPFVSEQNKQDIVGMVDATALTLNDREVSNLLHSISKMTIPWDAFPPAVQDNLLESFVRESPQLVSQQGSMSIYSLGLIGVDIESVSPIVYDGIYKVALSVLGEDTKNALNGKTPQIKRYACQQLNNVIYGLAKMGVQYKSMPPIVMKAFDKTVLETLPLLNEQEVSNVVYSKGLLGCKWADFNNDMRNTLRDTIISVVPNMITQGVSTTLYGMALMGAPWEEMGSQYNETILGTLVNVFGYQKKDPLNASPTSPRLDDSQQSGKYRNSRLGTAGGPQALSNIIYSLGVSGAEWSKFPEAFVEAITDGLEQWGNDLHSQEMSNLIYGLGLLRADYDLLSPRLRDTITKIVVAGIKGMAETGKKVEGRVEAINEQEVCSTLHGFAKMDAKWDVMPQELKVGLLEMTAQLAEMGSLCLACTAYSLGIMGCSWDYIPPRIRSLLADSAGNAPLEDQTISNVIYGLSLLGVSWRDMKSGLKNILLASLARDECFHTSSPSCSQHVCNTIWGLAKLDANWDWLPQNALVDTFVGCANIVNGQETANAFYGLAVMDASWESMPTKLQRALVAAFSRNSEFFTAQEAANCMYSFALLSFDANLKEPSAAALDPKSQYITSVLNSQENDPSANAWALHKIFLNTFKNVKRIEWAGENYDQFAIYFELMATVPKGVEFVISHLGEFPICSGPSGTVPSGLHTRCAHSMIHKLTAGEFRSSSHSSHSSHSPKYNIMNEFNGLGGVFPVDVGVYYDEKLVAFVEIDGEFHYKFNSRADVGSDDGWNGKLRRKDKLKEACYRHKYPDVPLFRIRSDQCEQLGMDRAGLALANWIDAHVNTLGIKPPPSPRYQIPTATSTAADAPPVAKQRPKKSS